MEKKSRTVLFAVLAIATIFAVQFSAAYAAKPITYNSPLDLTQFGGNSSEAFDINDKGQVVGTWRSTDSKTHAFVWSLGKGKVDLTTPTGSNSFAWYINKVGQIAGHYQTASMERAVMWTPENNIIELDPAGIFSSISRDINDKGEIVGYITSGIDIDPDPVIVRRAPYAFMWTPKTGWELIDVNLDGADASVARGINNQGQVVGYTITFDSTGDPATQRAFIWTAKHGTTFLETPDEAAVTAAIDINDKGEIVGFYSMAYGEPAHAIMWNKKGDIVKLEAFSDVGYSLPWAINDKGQVVGHCRTPPFHAFYWTAETGIVELNGLQSSSVSQARGINEKGQIAGASTVSGVTSPGSHAVIWNPK